MKNDCLCVAVAGCGVVGSGVVQMLTENQEIIKRASGRAVRLTHILDVRPVEAPEGVVVTDQIDAIFADGTLDVMVETIGGVRIALDFTQRALSRGVSVVTSNKELVATHGDALHALARAHGARYLYEAAVGGGVPVLRPIRMDLSGNRLTQICGIVNGSTNYLLTRMETMGLDFPAALGEAKALGYVEANPAADVEGHDARRKLAILAAEAFFAKLGEDEKIPTEGIARITEEDLQVCRARGGAVKLIARAQRTETGWTGFVRPNFVPEAHPLYAVRDVFNGICVRGDCVGDVMFYGRGAGMMATASAVVGDLIEIARANGHPFRWVLEGAPEFELPDSLAVDAIVRVRPEDREKAQSRYPEAVFVEAGDQYALEFSGVPFGRLDEISGTLRCIAMPKLS